MTSLSPDEIRYKFANSSDFNDLFDAFEAAIAQEIKDVELYRILFWNNSLSPDELCMFGEKLAKEFPDIAYDTYMWLASVFEVTYSAYDNFELAIKYYKRASSVKTGEPDPYLDACDCYDPDLNIPPLAQLIEFVQTGLAYVSNKRPLLLKLSRLYEFLGDEIMSEYYRRLAQDKGRSEAAGRN